MTHAAASPTIAWWASSPGASHADDGWRAQSRDGDALDTSNGGVLSPADAETIAQVSAGDRDAFDALYLRHYPMLHRLARHWCSSPDAADDLVQEIFVDLWMRRTAWIVRTSITAYFVGAVRNKLRRRFRDDATTGRMIDVWSRYTLSPGNSQTVPSPDDDAERRELVAAVTRAVQTLPPRQRMAALLHWHDGLTSGEIADVMEISDRVARKMIAAGVVKLRAALAEARELLG